MKSKKTQDALFSAANLPEEFVIKNTRKYISEMKHSFLKKARLRKELSLKEVAEKFSMPIEEMQRIEKGIVNEQDMMLLHSMSELYELNYFSLLSLFRLAERNPDFEYGFAAYHDDNIDNETQKELRELLTKLKDIDQ